MKVMDCHHFFKTGSCAEFYFKPLKRILSIYIKATTGTEINLEDPNILFTLPNLTDQLHIQHYFFHLKKIHVKGYEAHDQFSNIIHANGSCPLI
jgi:hypothetical protein